MFAFGGVGFRVGLTHRTTQSGAANAWGSTAAQAGRQDFELDAVIGKPCPPTSVPSLEGGVVCARAWCYWPRKSLTPRGPAGSRRNSIHRVR